ncbi:MAG: 50S ribosomal protein L24 [Propionibacteriaceae bacterium]
MQSLSIKKGDRVKVIAGKDKGKTGEVISVDPQSERVIVEGVNIVTRHVKDHQGGNGQVVKGGRVQSEAPIHVSNVALLVKVDGKEVTTRVGYKRVEVSKRRPDGTEYKAERSVRIARKTLEEI